MKFKKKSFEKLIFYFTFISFLFVGIKSYQDYGISLDEKFHRETGLLYYNYIKGFFFEFSNKVDSDLIEEIIRNVDIAPAINPVVFDTPIEFIIDLFQIKNSNEIFHLRHFVNFIYFFISIYFFYQILRKRFSNKIYPYIGILILFLSPRIFSDSFYNNKDIIFLSLTIINVYTALNLINKPSFKSSLFFSLTAALAFDVRVMAVLFIIVTCFMILIKSFEKELYFKKNFKYFLISLIFLPLFVIIFWPYLWTNFFGNLIFYFQNIPKMPVISFYLGEYVNPKDTPWHYNLVWILITSPITISILFMFGFFKIFLRNINRLLKLEDNRKNLWYGNKEMYDCYCLYILIISFLAIIIFDFNFDGWRHVYFLYPFIIAVSLSGIYFLNLYVNNKFFKIFIFTIIFFEIFYLAYWNFKNHPYQYVFFNPIFKNYAKNNFDLDYWGVSNKSALKFIIKHDDRNKIKISRGSFTSLESSLLILEKKETERIEIVHDLEKADYVISNFRKGWGKIKNINLLDERFTIIHDIKVDGIIINSIYKKNN